MPGPGTSDILSLLRNLPNALFVKGNWDNCLFEAPHGNLSTYGEIYFSRLAQYQHEQLNVEEIEFIKKLDLYQIKTFGELKILFTHHLPTKNWGRELVWDPSHEQLSQLFIEDDIDIAIYGHSHHQRVFRLNDKRLVINSGTIGQQFDKPGIAEYVTLEISENKILNYYLNEVSYDLGLELERAEEKKLPYFEVYKEVLTSGKGPKSESLKMELEGKYRDETTRFFKKILKTENL